MARSAAAAGRASDTAASSWRHDAKQSHGQGWRQQEDRAGNMRLENSCRKIAVSAQFGSVARRVAAARTRRPAAASTFAAGQEIGRAHV